MTLIIDAVDLERVRLVYPLEGGPTTRSVISVVAGTRPEIIKQSPLIEAIEEAFGRGAAHVIDTGQHFDDAMSGQIWSGVGIGKPGALLNVDRSSRAGRIGSLTCQLGRLLAEIRPAAVVVQGDTDSTLAGALAANAEGIPLVHVEAGLRSGDRTMPEEHNRIVVDHLADLCCAPTPTNVANLRSEGIAERRIVLTGNTIVEATERHLATLRWDVLHRYRLEPDRYLLATIHRPENTDHPEVLASILSSLGALADDLPVVLPLHPRTRLAVARAGLDGLLRPLDVLAPLPAAEFIALMASAAVIISDSGGIAEEVTVLKRPLVVVRRSTERPESIAAGFARLAAPEQISEAVRSILFRHRQLLDSLAITPTPYGDGKASSRITAHLQRLVTGTGSPDV